MKLNRSLRERVNENHTFVSISAAEEENQRYLMNFTNTLERNREVCEKVKSGLE